MNQYFQVNWVNGMKITSGHFVDLENHFISRIQNSIGGVINNLSYGLVPSREKNESKPEFKISFTDNKIKVLNTFCALTPEGDIIQIPANLESAINKPLTEAPAHYLVISMNPYQRVPYGEINEQESPLRFPDALPEYQFNFLPQLDNINHSFGNSIVAVAKYTGSTLEEDKSYIPPCTSVQSHPVLIELCNKVQTGFTDLEKKVLDSLRKPNVTNRMMLNNLVNFFNENKAAIDWYVPFLPPVFLAEIICKSARIIYYSSEIQNIAINDELKTLLQNIIRFNYNHLEIGKVVAIAKSFLDNYMKFLPTTDNVFGV